jgi:hypothetical protein
VNRRVIQGITTRGNLVPQARQRAPQQRHCAGNVRSRHRRAAKARICTIGGVIARTSACAWSSDIGLDAAASIDCHRAATAKASNRVGAGCQSADCVGGCIDARWICHSGTTRTGVTRCYRHHDSSGSLRFNGSLQRVSRTTLGRRTKPGVTRNVRRFGRVTFIGRAVGRIRRKKPLHALDVSGRCSVALIHVTAADPLCAGGHPDLVAHAVITGCSPYRMGAMAIVIAWESRIVTAGVAAAIVNGVVPVVIVIGNDSVPTAVVRLKRVMRPANTGIGTGHDNVLSGESQCPHLGRVRVLDAQLDRGRLRRSFLYMVRLRQVIVDARVAFHSRHVWTSCQCLSDLAVSLY